MLPRTSWLSRIRHRMRRVAIRLGLRLVHWAQSDQTAATPPENTDDAQAIARAKWFEIVRNRAPHLTRIERGAAPRLPKPGRAQPGRLPDQPDRDADSIEPWRKSHQRTATATNRSPPLVAPTSQQQSEAQAPRILETTQQIPPVNTDFVDPRLHKPSGPNLSVHAPLSPATGKTTESNSSESANGTGAAVRRVERDAATQESHKATQPKHHNRHFNASHPTGTGPPRHQDDRSQPEHASPPYSHTREPVLNGKLPTPQSWSSNPSDRERLETIEHPKATPAARDLSMPFNSHRRPESEPCPPNSRRPTKQNAAHLQPALPVSDPWPSLLPAPVVDSDTRLHRLEAGREQRLTDEQRGR